MSQVKEAVGTLGAALPPLDLQVTMRTGAILAALWTLVLVVSFLIYPAPDNLVTGFVVHLVLGVDGLAQLSALSAAGIGFMQIVLCFAAGYLVERLRLRESDP